MSRESELLNRAMEYTRRRGLVLDNPLGAGVHGSVFVARSQSGQTILPARAAVKVHERQQYYRREKDVYLRLQENGVTTILGCKVPQLLNYDDQLWVVEMTIVSRPFVLDFAGAYLDLPPEFSGEVIAEWLAEKQEQFEQHWPEVQKILRELESYGIYLVDVTPSNISLER